MTEPAADDRKRAEAVLQEAETASRTAYYDGNVYDGDAETLVGAIARAIASAYERGHDDGWIDGNRDGMAAGMGDV